MEGASLAGGGGRVVVFGGVPTGSKFELDPNAIHYNELTIICALNCTVEEYRESVDIARQLPLDRLITHRVPIESILTGYGLMADRIGLKLLVEMPNPVEA
jgi:threonine dehydrogenase-like Zn-dependent dehydrogenase